MSLQDRDLMVSDLLTRETREWNEAKVENLLPELKDHILTLRPSILGSPDTFIWPLQKSGIYTVKTGYNAIQATKNQSTSILLAREVHPCNKLIWSPPLSPKLKLFLWKVGNNALPTRANLYTRGLLTNTMCHRCGELETVSHILFQCPFAMEVWNLGPWEHTLDTSQQTSFFDKVQYAMLQVPLPPYGFTGNALPWICWTLWISRNLLLFENRRQTAGEVFAKALKEWELAQPLKKESTPKSSYQYQEPVETSREIICNTDASWKGGIRSAGLAWIFTDPSSQELQRGSSAQDFVSSPCMAEALAIREALLQAASLNYHHFCVKSDSQVLVNTISARRRSSELFGVLADIHDLAFC